jgi:hypothetical protein
MSPMENPTAEKVPTISPSPITHSLSRDPYSSQSLSPDGDGDNEEEHSDEKQQTDYEGEVWADIEVNEDDIVESYGEINNEGEDWGSENDVNNAGEGWGEVNNEGEDWTGSGKDVNNEGEDWDTPEPTTTSEPTSPKMPTPEPTSDPTIDLMSHLENLKTSYFCSESWDNIDCSNAEECPSGDSKGE